MVLGAKIFLYLSLFVVFINVVFMNYASHVTLYCYLHRKELNSNKEIFSKSIIRNIIAGEVLNVVLACLILFFTIGAFKVNRALFIFSLSILIVDVCFFIHFAVSIVINGKRLLDDFKSIKLYWQQISVATFKRRKHNKKFVTHYYYRKKFEQLSHVSFIVLIVSWFFYNCLS